MQNNNWQDKPEVKKGNIGEVIIRKYLEDKGYVIYEPVTDGAHHFDKVISRNKKFLAIAEIKTYERLKFKDETGINLKNYKEYLNIEIEVFVFFVDYVTKTIYGNKLKILNKEINIKGKSYPYVMESKTGKKMMFHLDVMKTISTLTDEQCVEIKKHSYKNNKYK